MPLQLIFTSAPQGLVAGRSGFCTVARHRAMPDRLAQLLEAIGTPHHQPTGETFTFRTLEASGKTWYVLSRFVARGLDYTQRDNRLAHHLAFTQEEAMVLPPPASFALRWKGWRDEWSETPTWLEGEDKPLPLAPPTPLIPAMAWRELTGTGSKAAWLVENSSARTVTLTNAPETAQVLRLFAESAALLTKAAWSATFTTDATITGAETFAWSIGPVSGRVEIDLSQAANLPAPSGDFARQAAMGVTSGNNTAAPKRTNVEKSSDAPAPREAKSNYALTISLTVFFVALASWLGWRYFHTPAPAPAPVVVKIPTPPPIDTAKADEIIRANRALNDVASYLARDDYVMAAKLWMQTCQISPEFSRKYSDQHLPRIKSKYAAATAQQLLARLEIPGATADPKIAQEIAKEALEAISVGEKLGVTQDDGWKRLTEITDRAQLVASLDLRPTLVLIGEWLTADMGASSPSSAEFKLNPNAAERLNQYIQSTGATSAKSIDARLRLLNLTSFHQRDTTTPFIRGEIRRGAQSNWIESFPEPGRLPAIAIGVGTRNSSIALNFKDNTATQLKTSNRLLEIQLGSGERFAIALLADLKNLKPLNLTLGALQCESSTGVVHAAPWAEPVVNSFIIVNAIPGLYPEGHEFPDRDLPSIRATRSVLETDIIRLERKFGPGTPSNSIIMARREALTAGDNVKAGAPWSLHTVDPKGNVVLSLLEFR